MEKCGNGWIEFMKCEVMCFFIEILKLVMFGKGKKIINGGDEYKLFVKVFEEYMGLCGLFILLIV